MGAYGSSGTEIIERRATTLNYGEASKKAASPSDRPNIAGRIDVLAHQFPAWKID